MEGKATGRAKLVVQHNKTKHLVTIDLKSTLTDLRNRLEELTKVAPENQSLFGARVKFNDDTASLGAIGLRDGMKLLLIGTDKTAVSSKDYPHIKPPVDRTDAICMFDDTGNVVTCSYMEGHLKQDVFVCQDCTKDNQVAGVCLGCVRVCHQGHKILELYSKRDFRCDCGNSKMSNECQFYKKEEVNEKNHYDHNFKGEYCYCKKSYDAENDDKMLQCHVCSEWFHDQHTDIPDAIDVVEETEQVFVCRCCVKKYPFLQQDGKCPITGLPAQKLWNSAGDAAPPATREQGGLTNQPVTTETSTSSSSSSSQDEEKTKKRVKEEDEEQATTNALLELAEKAAEAPPAKKQKTDDTEAKPEPQEEHGKASSEGSSKEVSDILLSSDWATTLCKCKECRKVYVDNNLAWLCHEELDNDKTDCCVIWAGGGTGGEDGGTTTDEATSADEGKTPVEKMCKIRGLNSAQQLHIAHGISLLRASLSDWMSNIKEGQLITEKEVEQWAADLEKKKKSDGSEQ